MNKTRGGASKGPFFKESGLPVSVARDKRQTAKRARPAG